MIGTDEITFLANMAEPKITPSDIRAQQGLDAFVRPTERAIGEKQHDASWKFRKRTSAYNSPLKGSAPGTSGIFERPKLRSATSTTA